MDDVTGCEREFYLDQLSEWQCCLREEIDDEYEAERQAWLQERLDAQARSDIETSFIFDDDTESLIDNNSASKTLLNTSTNRSGLARVSKPSSDTASQTDAVLLDQPKLCTDESKSMCAQVSTKCEVSWKRLELQLKQLLRLCIIMISI